MEGAVVQDYDGVGPRVWLEVWPKSVDDVVFEPFLRQVLVRYHAALDHDPSYIAGCNQTITSLAWWAEWPHHDRPHTMTASNKYPRLLLNFGPVVDISSRKIKYSGG